MTLVAPALRGDDALGFLAAVGIVALSEQGEIPPLRLSWNGRSAPVAAFDGVSSLNDLGDALRAVVERLGERREAIPGLGEEFPIVKKGSGTDPMRMPRDEMAGLYAEADRRWTEDGDPRFARWLMALAGQATVKDAKRQDIELTPFYAPTGQMSLRNSLFDATGDALRRIAIKGDAPTDALVRWRRTEFDGGNFDDRAKRDAAVTTTGSPDNRAAPSPTWLAVMGICMFPMTDAGSAASTVGWQRVRLYPGFTRRSLVWPIWTMPLNPQAVRTVLAHPLLALEGPADDPRLPRSAGAQLSALGIQGVFGASRRTATQGDGPLGPARRLWPPPAGS